MSAGFDHDGWDSGRSPTISPEKWTRFAIEKMQRGYSLIISDARKNASFFMTGKGYDGCPYRSARRLVELGLVRPSGRHPLGCMYSLDPDAVADLDRPRPKTPIRGRRRFDREPDCESGDMVEPDGDTD